MAPESSGRAADPYDVRPSFGTLHADGLVALAVAAATVALTIAIFPVLSPFRGAPELAYAFAVPAILWAYRSPPFKLFAWTLLAAQGVAWTILLWWLHPVTWAGLFLLGPFVGAWVGVWYLAVWWTMPLVVGRPTSIRLAAQLGLAGLWVLIEWSRTWFLGGFPWLPLAASQWQFPSVLQIAAYTGAYGISFVVIAVNIGFAAYAHRLFFEAKGEVLEGAESAAPLAAGFNLLRRRSQEFMLAVFLILVCFCVFLVEVQPFARWRLSVPLGEVAFVQPDIPQEVKWDPARGPGIIRVLQDLTLTAAANLPNLILWPEAVTPWAVKGDAGTKAFVESLAARARAPILLGSVAVEPGERGDKWYNAAFVVAPDFGLQTSWYAKRHLVPFGEYVPLRPLFGWLSKAVPIGDDFTPGADPAPLIVPMGGGSMAFGVLICYEDIFPQLARRTVLSGADALAVLTNDAWYGEGAAAYQHAAHSVLRAVETRRPVLRCGNAGWSGWIDEFGMIRGQLADASDSVYFRGTRTIEVKRDSRWIGRNSFYVEHGDAFVLACLVLASFGWATIVTGRPRSRKG